MKILRKNADYIYAKLEQRDRQFSLRGADYSENDVLVFSSSADLSLGSEMLVAPNMPAAEEALRNTPPHLEFSGSLKQPIKDREIDSCSKTAPTAEDLLAILESKDTPEPNSEIPEDVPSEDPPAYSATAVLAALESHELVENSMATEDHESLTKVKTPQGSLAATSHDEIIEAVARNMLDTQRALQDEQNRGDELERILSSKNSREKELEMALEAERRRATSKEKAVAVAEAKVEEQARAARAASDALEKAKLATADTARMLDEHMARKERLEKDLEAEKNRRSGKEAAIAELESKIEEQRRSAQEAAAALEAAVEMRRSMEEDRDRMAAEARVLADALQAEKSKAENASRDVSMREALAEEAREAARETRRELEKSITEKNGLLIRLEEAESEIARKADEIERMKSAYDQGLRKQKESSESELEEERRRATRELDAMRKQAQETADALRSAKAEQERAALEAERGGSSASELSELICQTKTSLQGYERLISDIKARQESSLIAEEGVRAELENTKRDLDGKVDDLKESIATIGRGMAAHENALSVPTQYGSVTVRHVHEFPSAPSMTLPQKASLAASKTWDAIRQAVFWAAIAVALSIAATMLANNETLPQAAETLYVSTIGMLL